ncbi:MAG: CarD family transcriptional regulator [Myxococcales bacterium]|nr:CarD family transcriptional regulator [Myxococcales bacterium]MCB9526227.1 CarD family transcriptional regulator [Myxococcales bacterium]
MPQTFNVGDMAVYPAQGVAEILGIETLEISGFTNKFYVLRCLDSEKKIRVPVANVEQVGLRALVAGDAIDGVLTVLQADEVAISEPNWNRRYRRYVEKIQTGSLVDVAQVLRDLHLTRADKQLSYGERRVYEMAMQLLVQELAVAQERSEEEVTAQVEALLA